MMTRITLLCAAVALGVGSSGAAALPSARPTAVTRDVAVATITGHVTDATGRPLASAQVFVVGTQLRALTNAEGRYSIAAVPNGAQTVRAMLIGFAPQTRAVTVGDQPVTLDFSLTAQTVQLEAVVTTGYGTQRRQDITGAVSSVNVNNGNRAPNAVTSLTGTRSGANVTLGFTLPVQGDARIEVLDLAGRRTWSWEGDGLSAGSHAVRWDGIDHAGGRAPVGLYWVRLTAAGGSRVAKLARVH